MNATLPAVAGLGPKLTANFYQRLFKKHPELLDTFNVSLCPHRLLPSTRHGQPTGRPCHR